MAVLFLLFTPVLAITENASRADSLASLLSSAPADTARVHLLNRMFWTLVNRNKDSAVFYAGQGMELAKKLGDQKGLAESHLALGEWNRVQGNYENALKHDYEALKISEALKNERSMASALTNIGIIQYYMGHIEEATGFFERSLAIRERLGNKKDLAGAYNNMAVMYRKQKMYDKALEFAKKALAMKTELGDTLAMARSLNGMANVYRHLEEYDEALAAYQRALGLLKSGRSPRLSAECLSNMGDVFDRLGAYGKEIDYLQRALELAEKVNARHQKQGILKNLASAFSKTKNYSRAYHYHTLYAQMKDSLLNEKNQEQMAEMAAKYESEKKEMQIKVLEKEKAQQAALAAEESKRQKLIIGSVSGGLALVIVFSFFLYKRFRITRRQKAVIEVQKEEVEMQKELVEEKNKEILDSITYAKRIQNAILPPQKLVKQYLEESFILYKPKDIVAGDFYWIEPGENLVFFAAADCTGHGVPGAMVSVVCNNALNRSVREYGLTDPGKILDKAREIVIQEFEKSDEDVKDGMDISLCKLSFPDGEESGRAILEWAGANNPLWIINPARREWPEITKPILARNRTARVGAEIKPDKQPIGKYSEPAPFTTHRIRLQKGDSIYIFSDGFADQFGGDKGKKFKSKAFKELLLFVQDHNMAQQRALIDEAFEKWKGTLEQVDDVCVIGVRR